MSEFGEGVGQNLVSFVIVGVFGMVWWVLKNKCKHCKSHVNSGCCEMEIDDKSTIRDPPKETVLSVI